MRKLLDNYSVNWKFYEDDITKIEVETKWKTDVYDILTDQTGDNFIVIDAECYYFDYPTETEGKVMDYRMLFRILDTVLKYYDTNRDALNAVEIANLAQQSDAICDEMKRLVEMKF